MLCSVNREVDIYHGERFNSITHLVGAALSVAGTSVLITLATVTGDIWKIVATSVYGGMLVLLYTISTLYHSFQGRSKQIFQKLDHIAIYLLIAGTYTPFTLITLRGPWGWWLFGINWTLALVGITYELTLSHRTRVPSMIIYVLMGWLVVVAMKPLTAALPSAGIFWLALGGLLYTGGIGFFLYDEKVKHFHGIWHLFVLGGSACQYFCILFYLI
ncbi:hemolysin III family protein [Bdellovibrio bacteriovorus]|uniref:Hemolysin III n=1 Tax=Bdellovibrio bacteriovorus (strain ATCC 15356 / DSM 50701 / NCIMB 9529 / HD100) TaxID=264462 RepID=Q6MQ31_BDEBA|nr:hemolysin III family protein [Bdellovibrio bacteriovorus]CAE78616.1 hemolysin III [Bdellovibrio bacteriovorus HD100]